MADVFLSYAREDRIKAGAIADALKAGGWTGLVTSAHAPTRSTPRSFKPKTAAGGLVIERIANGRSIVPRSLT